MTDFEKYIIILHFLMLVASRLSHSCQATKVATVGDISKLFDENFPKLPLKTVEVIGYVIVQQVSSQSIESLLTPQQVSDKKLYPYNIF